MNIFMNTKNISTIASLITNQPTGKKPLTLAGSKLAMKKQVQVNLANLDSKFW
jgi:hypothetical protein